MLQKIRIFSKMHMVTVIILVMSVLTGSYFFLAQRASRLQLGDIFLVDDKGWRQRVR